MAQSNANDRLAKKLVKIRQSRGKQKWENKEGKSQGKKGGLGYALKVNLPQALLTKHEERRPTDNAYKKGAEISTNTRASSNFHIQRKNVREGAKISRSLKTALTHKIFLFTFSAGRLGKQ